MSKSIVRSAVLVAALTVISSASSSFAAPTAPTPIKPNAASSAPTAPTPIKPNSAYAPTAPTPIKPNVIGNILTILHLL